MKAFWKDEYLCEWSGAPSIPEARLIKKVTGLLPEKFMEAVEQMDPDAWAVLVKVLLKRNGQDVRVEEVDGDYNDLRLDLTEDEKRKKAEAEVDEVAPVIKKILVRLDVPYDHDGVRDVVLDELAKAQDAKDEEGKDEPSEAAVPATDGETPTSTS